MTDGYDKSRDLRRIEWTARALQRLGDIFGEWKDCRGAGWIELDAASDTAILRSLAATVSLKLLTVAARLQAEGDAEPLAVPLLDELIEAYALLGGEIVRHAIAAGAALDRLKGGGPR